MNVRDLHRLAKRPSSENLSFTILLHKHVDWRKRTTDFGMSLNGTLIIALNETLLVNGLNVFNRVDVSQYEEGTLSLYLSHSSVAVSGCGWVYADSCGEGRCRTVSWTLS